MFTCETKRFEMRGGTKWRKISGECLDAEISSLPTEHIINGSDMLVLDSGRVLVFDEAGSQWVDL